MSEGKNKDADLPPVCWFHGEDTFMMERAVTELADRLIDEESRPFDFELLHADEVGPEEVAAAANRLPFMSGKRLVVLKRVEKWTAARIQKLTEIYLADPSPETILLLCYGDKPDRRSKTIKAVEKAAGQVRAFAPTGGRQLVSWVENYFSQRGMVLEPGAAETVVEYLGSDLHRLKSELQKVELFHAGREGPITVQQIGELLERVAVQPAWDLAPLLARGEKKAALSLLVQLLESGEDAIRLLALIAGHYRQLEQARAVVEEGGGPSQLEAVIAGPPWLKRKMAPLLLGELRSLDDHRLAASRSHLVWADRYLKRTGKEMQPVVMTALAFRLVT